MCKRQAQDVKPGKGDQLPGGKVNGLITRLRCVMLGVTLISPPPYHNIYSIENLAQLIFDLKQVNSQALVSVKLVSEPGTGIIAAGVAGAYTDLITISGYDGGTGASPITSIKYAGLPWELGLAEAYQTLCGDDLCSKIRVQTDGDPKTSLDAVKAAVLGAESFGFGTAPMIVLGCKCLRIYRLNSYAIGVATQNDKLRKDHFIDTTVMVINSFTFIATKTHGWPMRLGVRSLGELIGRTDLLEILPGGTAKQQNLDLAPLLGSGLVLADKPQLCEVEKDPPFNRDLLAEKMVELSKVAVGDLNGGEYELNICSCNRSTGTRVSGEIARLHGNQGTAKVPVVSRFKGTAGQSFDMWNASGLHLYLEGDANDYVGESMTGGKLVITPPRSSPFKTQGSATASNTCLYGATNDKLLTAGTVGERFAAHNSGSHVVVKGTDDYYYEYAIDGFVYVLGKTGYNFGSGTTGGLAYILDTDNTFVGRASHELVEIQWTSGETTEAHCSHLRKALVEYVNEMVSGWDVDILENPDNYLRRFWLVKSKATNPGPLLTSIRANPQ